MKAQGEKPGPQGQFHPESVAVNKEANGQMNIARRLNLASENFNETNQLEDSVHSSLVRKDTENQGFL